MTSNAEMPPRKESAFRSNVGVEIPARKESAFKSAVGMSGATSRMRQRKSSYGYSGIAGIGKAAEKQSMLGAEYRRPMLLFLNTYQLDPTDRFHVPAVTKVAENLLDELFTDHKYNSEDSPGLALRLSGDILKEVKRLCFNRYRIISVVAIAQRRAQSYNNAITFLWDHERDGYVDLYRESATAFVQLPDIEIKRGFESQDSTFTVAMLSILIPKDGRLNHCDPILSYPLTCPPK